MHPIEFYLQPDPIRTRFFSDRVGSGILPTLKFCVIQDHNSRMLIGAGEQREGLYYFRSLTSVKVIKVAENDSVDLWHQRLDHPSNKVIKLLPIVNRNNNKCTDECEVCVRAKHCRKEFVSSDNKASNVFEKIHCDL